MPPLRRIRLPLIVLACLAPAAAWAGSTITAADIMNQFNLVPGGGLSASADTAGAPLVGGTLSGGPGVLQQPATQPSDTPAKRRRIRKARDRQADDGQADDGQADNGQVGDDQESQRQ